MIIFETNMGNIHINVDAEKAPISAQNFMIQSGVFTEEMSQKAIKSILI